MSRVRKAHIDLICMFVNIILQLNGLTEAVRAMWA
jgi:hypothetical protein